MRRRIKLPIGWVTIERRLEVGLKASLLVSLLSLALAFLVAGSIFQILGFDAFEIYKQVSLAFINPQLLHDTILRSVPIILAALGLSIAFRMNFWNIGAEGQIYMGMFAATGVVLQHVYYGFWSAETLLPVMMLAAFLAGGSWCAFTALLKSKFSANEIITTLMLNYIAILFVNYLVYGPWRDPEGYRFPLSVAFPEYARPQFASLPLSGSGLLIVLGFAAIVFIIFNYTKVGFEIRVIGLNVDAARYAGMSISRTLVTGAFLSGGLAGLGGLTIVSSLIGRLRPDASPGYGYVAIIVAFLAGLNPWLIVPAGLLFGGLFTAGDALQASLGMPKAAVQMMQAIIFLFIVLGEFIKRFRVAWQWVS